MADFNAYKLTFTAPLVNTTGTITITQATTSTDGYVSSTDWNTFNEKATNPMTTEADIIVAGASGVPARLAKGTSLQVLRMNAGATAQEYATISTGGLLISEDAGFGLDNSSVGRGTVGTNAVSLEYSASGTTYGATGLNATASGGLNNTASSQYSIVSGGEGNIASGTSSIVLSGQGNTASEIFSSIGGSNGLVDKYGENGFSSGQFSSQGDCQRADAQYRINTATTSETELLLNGNDSSPKRFTLTDGDSYVCEITVLGKQSDGSMGRAKYEVMVYMDGTTTSLEGSANVVRAWAGSANLGTPTFAITADDTNEALAIKVTPANTTATRWTALLEYVKINF